jgi:hyperosmotically inducible protein
MRNIIIKGLFLAAALSAATPAGVTAVAQQFVERPNDERQQVAKKVRKALVTLPFYGVFDNLEYRSEEGTVILSGQVVRPATRDDAERRVARIRGVARVVNNIEVLPLSGFDDSIRARTARAIFNTGGLGRYALGANPSIHIIVKRGHVTLEGVVANRGDRQLASLAANGVPGVFSVTNNLRTDRDERAPAR